MEPKYKYSESTVKPEVIEMNGDTVYLRTDISKIARENEEGFTTTYWSYQEARLSQKEFNVYSSMIVSKNALNSTNVPDHISQLIVGQENGDNNQLILMEAIADLYDVIAILM